MALDVIGWWGGDGLTGSLEEPIGKRNPKDRRNESHQSGREHRPQLFIGRLHRDRTELNHCDDGPDKTLQAKQQGRPGPDQSDRPPLPDQKSCDDSRNEKDSPGWKRVPRQPSPHRDDKTAKQGIELGAPPCGDHTTSDSPWMIRGLL